jgi:hypothetical protein
MLNLFTNFVLVWFFDRFRKKLYHGTVTLGILSKNCLLTTRSISYHISKLYMLTKISRLSKWLIFRNLWIAWTFNKTSDTNRYNFIFLTFLIFLPSFMEIIFHLRMRIDIANLFCYFSLSIFIRQTDILWIFNAYKKPMEWRNRLGRSL